MPELMKRAKANKKHSLVFHALDPIVQLAQEKKDNLIFDFGKYILIRVDYEN